MLSSPIVVALLLAATVPQPAAVDTTFDSNGVPIRYIAVGTGDPVVLIHGWMGDSGMWGRLDTNPAAKEYHLIALDCRGHGKSGKPHDPDKYGAEMAADVVRLLDHLKLPKAHLIGYSMGAFVAGKVAATHPDRVLSVVYGGQAPLVAGYKSAAPGVDEVAVFAKAVDDGDLGAYILATVQPGKKKPTPEQAKALATFMFAGKDVKAFAAAGRSFGGLRVTEAELTRCKAPALFVHGGDEWEDTRARVAAAHKLLGQSTVTVVKGADHISTPARPEFSAAIRDFLKANKQK